METISENSNKVTFRLEPMEGNPKEITADSYDIFKSVIPNEYEYEYALYGGEKIDINKSISDLKITEGTGVILCKKDENVCYNQDKSNLSTNQPTSEPEKNLEIVKNRESPKTTQVSTKYHKHGLVFLYSNENWKCQKCHMFKKNSEPKYHCSLSECNFNICKTCIENNTKYPLTDFTHKQIYLMKYKFSFHNHPLIYSRSSRHHNNLNFWNCNVCHLTFTNRIWSFYCTYCDYDLCLICAKKYVPQDDLLNGCGIKINEHDHTLIYLINNKKWLCKLCSKSYDSNIAKFYCSICDFNVCNSCKEKINHEKKNMNLNTNLRKYSDITSVDIKYHNHSLIYCNTSRNEKETSWFCDKCKIKYGPQNWSFYCTKCDYDLCDNCYKNQNKK